MQTKEQKICSFTQKDTRLQLIRITKLPIPIINGTPCYGGITKFQVRLNRKIIESSISEYQMRKVFATYIQNIVLQLKIY